MIRALTVIAAAGLLVACSRPEMPDKDKPVEPQAQALKRSIDAPLARARAAQAAVDAAAKAQDAAIDAASDAAPAQ